MVARRRLIAFLLAYHLVLGTIALMWGKLLPTTHLSGCLLAFGMPTVQFTWGFTLGLILGPSRKLRPWYWLALLFIPIPLQFTCIAAWLAFHFLGLWIATVFFVVCFSVIVIETVAGVMVGVDASTRFSSS